MGCVEAGGRSGKGREEKRGGGREDIHRNQAEYHAPTDAHEAKIDGSVETMRAANDFLQDLLFLLREVGRELAPPFLGFVGGAAVAI